MTCVVGFCDGKDVYIGADSAAISGNYSVVRTDWRVFKKDGFIFGSCGSYRAGQSNTFQVVERLDRFTAIGDGYAYALGVMTVLAKMDNVAAQGRLGLAIAAAEKFCPSVKFPITVVWLKGESEVTSNSTISKD